MCERKFDILKNSLKMNGINTKNQRQYNLTQEKIDKIWEVWPKNSSKNNFS